MLDDQPFAILTPFTRSGLPKDEDIARICDLTPLAYITSPRDARVAKARSEPVEAMARGATRYLRNAEPPTGHIRLRADRSSGAWRVDLDRQAHRLCA